MVFASYDWLFKNCYRVGAGSQHRWTRMSNLHFELRGCLSKPNVDVGATYRMRGIRADDRPLMSCEASFHVHGLALLLPFRHPGSEECGRILIPGRSAFLTAAPVPPNPECAPPSPDRRPCTSQPDESLVRRDDPSRHRRVPIVEFHMTHAAFDKLMGQQAVVCKRRFARFCTVLHEGIQSNNREHSIETKQSG